MIRGILRLFLLVYFVVPLVGLVLIFTTLRQISSDLTPIYEAANQAISTSANTLSQELEDLGSNFQPLVSAVNSLRTAVNAVAGFIGGILTDVINVVDDLWVFGDFNFNGLNITIPPLVNLSFIDRISDSVTTIAGQVDTLVTSTTTAINSYTTTFGLAIGLMVIWLLLSYVLFFVQLYGSLWHMT